MSFLAKSPVNHQGAVPTTFFNLAKIVASSRQGHIADATAARIRQQGLRSPGLMATGFTMEQGFYTERLVVAGLTPIIPEGPDRAETHRIIYEELCCDVVTQESEASYIAIAQRLVDRGVDCLILGCTEVGMLLNQGNVSVPVFVERAS